MDLGACHLIASHAAAGTPDGTTSTPDKALMISMPKLNEKWLLSAYGFIHEDTCYTPHIRGDVKPAADPSVKSEEMLDIRCEAVGCCAKTAAQRDPSEKKRGRKKEEKSLEKYVKPLMKAFAVGDN